MGFWWSVVGFKPFKGVLRVQRKRLFFFFFGITLELVGDIGILRFHAWSKTMEMFMARLLSLSHSVL